MEAGPDIERAPARGVRMGIDVGSVRIGIALSDPDGILASPESTVARDPEASADIGAIVALVTDRNVVEVVVGLPVTLAGRSGPSAQDARGFADVLAGRIAPVPVLFVDERLTSVTANRILTERRVPARSRRGIVDQIAAVEILQTRLDRVRTGGWRRG